MEPRIFATAFIEQDNKYAVMKRTDGKYFFPTIIAKEENPCSTLEAKLGVAVVKHMAHCGDTHAYLCTPAVKQPENYSWLSISCLEQIFSKDLNSNAGYFVRQLKRELNRRS